MDSQQAHEYCFVHDRPLDWCPAPDTCRKIMKSWGLYPDDAKESED